MTNGEHLKEMSYEELCNYVTLENCVAPFYKCPLYSKDKSCDSRCKEAFLEWLKQDVNYDGGK